MRAQEFTTEGIGQAKPLLKDLVAWPNIAFDRNQATKIPKGTMVRIAVGGDFWRQNMMKFEAEMPDGKTEIWFTGNDAYLDATVKPYKARVKEDDIDDQIDADMANPERRRERLKAEIEAGMVPTVLNASGSSSPVYTMGDLEFLDWAEKSYTHDSSGEVDGVEWYYTGPKPFKLHTTGGEPRRIDPGEVI